MLPSTPYRVLVATLALLVAASLALPAAATSLTTASMNWTVEGTGQTGTANMLSLAQTTCASSTEGGSCALDGWTPGNGFYTVNGWSSSWESDPFVTNNLNLTNNTAATMTFDVTVIAPIIATGPQTAMSGSIGITLTNTVGSASVADSAASIYRALIDSSVVRTLFDAPVTTITCSTTACTDIESQSFGVFPSPPELGPQANTDIAIRLRFTLSPGDSIGITSIFNIEAVPEPETALLVALGLTGLAAAGRRRR